MGNYRYEKRNRFSRNRSRGSRNRMHAETINSSKYIKKATIKEEVKFDPQWIYDDLKVNEVLKKNITSKQYVYPTPIQEQAIPAITNGKDILGIANTGTGKTCAFLIPLIQKVYERRNEKVLIIAPTRELAEQIDEEFKSLGRGMNMYSTVCTGGNNIFKQIKNLQRGCSFVIGTPGRLLDLHERGELEFDRFNNIVLDEVDRMLDMGFITDIKSIIKDLPKERQALFFSATTNRKVEEVINLILDKECVKISVKMGDTSQNIDQDIVRFKDSKDKMTCLEGVLSMEDAKKVLVFVNTKRYVDQLEDDLREKGYAIATLHGDKRQRERSRAVEMFKAGKAKILIATDVAARGLDINNITHVVNYDEPNTFDDYIHRIGRTGRGDKTGIALTFVRS